MPIECQANPLSNTTKNQLVQVQIWLCSELPHKHTILLIFSNMLIDLSVDAQSA